MFSTTNQNIMNHGLGLFGACSCRIGYIMIYHDSYSYITYKNHGFGGKKISQLTRVITMGDIYH